MKLHEIKPGSVVSYSDGRPGHVAVKALVISTDTTGMTVQFEDRADTTRIKFSDRAWMDFIIAVTQ
jgi:hypothetical protein